MSPGLTRPGWGARDPAAANKAFVNAFFRGSAANKPQVDSMMEELHGLDVHQAGAVRLAIAKSGGVVAVTGEAGAGKTEVIAALAKVLERQKRSLLVLAVAHKALYNVRARLEGQGLKRVSYATLAKIMV